MHLQRSVIVHYVFGGHPATSAICSRHEPVLELGGKHRDVGGNLLSHIRYVVFTNLLSCEIPEQHTKHYCLFQEM